LALRVTVNQTLVVAESYVLFVVWLVRGHAVDGETLVAEL